MKEEGYQVSGNKESAKEKNHHDNSSVTSPHQGEAGLSQISLPSTLIPADAGIFFLLPIT